MSSQAQPLEALSLEEKLSAVKARREQLGMIGMKLMMENPLFAVDSAEIRGNSYRVFKNAPQNMAEMLAQASSHGDKDFIIHEDERISFAETWSRACRLANVLKASFNLKKGDRVAIAMRNYPEWCIGYMAVMALGGVVVPLNAWWKSDELEFALKDCEAKTVIVDAKRMSYIRPFSQDMGLTLILARGGIEDIDGEGGLGDNEYSYEDLLETNNNTTMPAHNTQPEDDYCILYTSGSTGKPKGVILTHRSSISTLLSWMFLSQIIKTVNGGVSPFGEVPGILVSIPLFHVTGMQQSFLLSYIAGRKIAFMYRWSGEAAVDIINKEKLTNFMGVPSQAFELIEASGEKGLPTMLDIRTGGAKCPPEHGRQLIKKFPHAGVAPGYGLSETCALGSVMSKDDYALFPDSTGVAAPPVTDLKIMNVDDENDFKACGVNEAGEIWLRSPANFRGYLNLPELTERTLSKDGWFRTGDIGRVDENGLVFILDRIKDIIIRGGENISCAEVEARVYEFAGVSEAAVFSVPDELLGERVGLVVFPKPDTKIDIKALRNFIADDLAGFKVPEKIWISPMSLPRLASEKFDKNTVRTIALQNKPDFETS